MPHEPIVLVLAATLIILRVLCTKPLLNQLYSGTLNNSPMKNPLQAEGLVKNTRVQASRYTGSYGMLAE